MESSAKAAAARNAARGVSSAHSLFGVRHSQAREYTATTRKRKPNGVPNNSHERKHPRMFKPKARTLRVLKAKLKANARTLHNHISSHNAQNVEAMLKLEGIKQELDRLRKQKKTRKH